METQRKQRWLLATLALGTVCIMAHAASSEEAPPAAPRARTIGDVLSSPVRDEVVTVRGKVVRRVAGNDYVLDDGTGNLVVDGGPIEKHSLDLPLDTHVEITGEVSLGPSKSPQPRSPEISIFSVTKADGTVVQIRGAKPHWAGSE
jgi:uncharacterized protein YdeI (BOF family)